MNKLIPSLENRYSICLDTNQVINVRTKKTLTTFHKGGSDTLYIRYKWKTKQGVIQGNRSIPSLLLEVSPHYWIYQLEEGEEVRPIIDYEGYFITTWGRVFTTRNKHQFVNLYYTPPYYYKVCIYTPEGKQVSTFSHILVGRNFLPDYESGKLILHKDETLPFPEINHPNNLWVGSHTDNHRDMMIKGRHPGRGPNRQKKVNMV